MPGGLGPTLGVVHRGPGAHLDPERMQADIDQLIEGEIEDREGHLERGVWGLPKAVHRTWVGSGGQRPHGR